MVLLFSFSLLSNAQNKAIDELASQKSLMSYNLGLCNADGFSKYIADTYKIDTIADIDIVLMGIEDEQDNYNLVDNRAYKIGRSLKPMIKEKMDLDIEISKLKLLKANHLSQKYALEDASARAFPSKSQKRRRESPVMARILPPSRRTLIPMGTASLRLHWRASPMPTRRRRARRC